MNNLAPIGVFTYSRINHLRQTIEALKNNTLARESELYIFSDAAKPGDEDKILEVREYIHGINGFKIVKLIERETNGYLKNARDGIRQLLNVYGRCIIMEDDNVTAPGFLRFMNEALNFYKNDDRIFSICGYCPPIKIPPDYNSDVFILRRFSAWGYGVWNDSYKKISYLDNAEVLGRFSNKREVEELSKYGEDLLNMILLDAAGKMDAFDVKIFYHQFLNEKYTIYPKKSLVRNIGLDGSGMHCSKTNKFDVDLWDKLDFEISGKVKLDNRIVKSNYIFRQIGKNNKFMENTNTSTRGNILERGKLGENLIFLISQPRAGSTLLQRILSGHSDIYTTAEPWIMLHPLYALKEKGLSAEFDSNLARQGLEDFTSQVPEGKDLYIEALRQMGGKLYDRVLAVSGKQIFLDKTPRYYLIIPELKKIFPEAKFIILLRNPLAVLSSTLKTWFQNNPANLQKSQNYIDVIQGPLYLIQGIQLLKEDAIVVKYEELVEDAENSVKAISNKLGIAFQQEMLTYGAKPKPKGRFGDAVGVAKHDKAVPYYIDKWVENLQSSQLYEFSLKYMEALGPDIFNLMGYSYTETKSKLERLEDVAYHGVEIKEDPISIKQKETDKESIKSVGMKNNAEERILVSAIVSTYNSQRFISGRLEDLENQTIADRLEIVVVNSGSQQNEEKIIKEFQEKYSNIKYIKTNQRETVYAAWNRGIEASQGKYITSANTDDRLRQDAFEVMVNTLEASPEIALVYADVIITETENETFERCTPVGNFKWLNFSRDDLLNKGCFVGPQPMWRREVHDEYGFFDASFVTSGDYEFWLRISQSNTFMHLPVQLGLYLRSPGSIEHSNREKQREENRKILDMYRKARSCGKIIRRLQGSTSAGDTEPRSENMKSPETIYRNIQTEIGNKQPEEIISEMEMLAASYPEFALAHNDLGVLHYHAGNKEKAHQSYEKAVQLDSENMVFQKNLADFYYVELGRVEDALRIYVKILEANPEDVETLLITGHICVSLHKFEDAQAFYRRVLALEPLNEAAQKNLGKLSRKGPIQSELKPAEDMYQEIQPLLNNGDAHKAIASLTGLLERFPDFELAHNDLGVLYYHTGDKEKAQFHYERAVELMPDNINFQKNLADFYCIELGRIEDALKIYVRILTTDPQDVETLMATGQICKAFEKHDDARDFFNQVLQIEPWNADARKQIEEMERQLSGVSLNSESAEDAYRRLQESLNTLTPEEAIVELEKLVESYPDFAVGHNELAVLYYNTGNKEKSLRYYQQAAHLQPENMTLQKNLADFLFVELGKVDDALQIYVDLLTTHPDDVDTLLITGHICVALKKFDDAKDYYERVVALEPGNQDANNYLQALTNRQNGRSSARPDVLNDVTVSSAKAESTDLNSEESENQDAQPQPTVSIFISLDGIQNRVKQCIQSISAHTEEPHEIILINSGATKGVLKWAQNLTQDNTHYQLVKCDKMHSWAQGLNQAVKAAAGDYIVLMHNDVIVADRWLPGMLQCFRAGSGTGIVGPMTNATSGIQKAYFSEERDPNRLEPDAKAFYAQNQHRRISTTQLASFFLMFRHELIDKIGDFDAHLVSEQAVVADFCKRSAAWGFQNLVAGDVFVYHADRHKDSRKTADAVQVPAEDQKRLKENWNKMKGDRRFLKSTHMMSLLETVNKLHQGGYVDQAVEALLNAIGALPEETRLYLALAEISISLKRYQDAIDTLNEMPDDAKTEMDSEETGNLNEPGLQSPSLVISENHEMKTLEILGYAEEGLENFAAAETYADRMLAIDPKSARALNLKGILAYRKEDPNSAEQFFEKSVASDPGAGEPYSNLATVKLAANQEEEAWELFEKAFILNPTDFDIATNYHTLVASRGEHKRAEDIVRAAAAIYPNSQKINYMLIDVLLQQGKHDEAMGKIEAAIIKFGIEDGILAAALKVREKLGSMTIQPSKKKAAVSCCMIIKDEEKYLARCLASVKPIADEMIVVDTGSTDRSKDIATAFGAQVYDLEWQKDFAKARNFSLEKASGDWVLILDGDEVISALDYKHFNRIVKNRPKAPVAYSIVTRNYSALANIIGWVPNDGKYVNEEAAAGWIPSIKTRLFYGKDQIWFEGAVHELVDPVVKRKGFETKQCSIPVHHYGRLDKERLKRKGEVYFEIGKKKMEEMGDDIFAVREMAVQATTLEENEMAIELWQKMISLDPPELMAADAYINMATLYNRLSNFEQALSVAKKAVAKAPHIKESLYNYALAELHVGNAQATIKALEDLVKRMPDYPPAQFILSAAYFCIGEKEKGFKIIQDLQGTDLGPNLVYPIFELAETLLEAQRNEYAVLLLGTAIEYDIVNKPILELFKKCIQIRETAKNSPESHRPLPLDRQSINFENLPQ